MSLDASKLLILCQPVLYKGPRDAPGQRSTVSQYQWASISVFLSFFLSFCLSRALLWYLPSHTRPTLNSTQQQLQSSSASSSSSTLLFLHPSFPTVLKNLSSHIKLKTSSHRCGAASGCFLGTHFQIIETVDFQVGNSSPDGDYQAVTELYCNLHLKIYGRGVCALCVRMLCGCNPSPTQGPGDTHAAAALGSLA